MHRLLTVVMAVLFFSPVDQAGTEVGQVPGIDLLDGEYWRAQVVEDLIPRWYEHVRDEKDGAFFMNLSRQWQPQPPWDKVPAMISRQVFAFSAAYLLSGEEKYLATAREGAHYLLEHAWDREYGGWFNSLTQSGAPLDTNKTVALQLYTNVGLAMYGFTTGDDEVLSRVKQSVAIQQIRAHDAEFDGYYSILNRDLSPVVGGKAKHAHYGYVGSLIHLYQATRDADFLQWERRVMDLTATRMMDSQLGWVYGYRVELDRQWRRLPAGDRDEVLVGAQLTAALAFLRLAQQSGDAKYAAYGKALGDLAVQRGWDGERGGWFDFVGREPPFAPGRETTGSWWVQIYGAFLQLQLYHNTQDKHYLERFEKMEKFYVQHFIDSEYGGVFANVSREGALVDERRKAFVWKTSYHEVEHGLLNYLYLNLYLNHKPAVLHFKLNGDEGTRKHFVSLVDDPGVELAGVRINNKPWSEFDAQERSVSLPAGKDLRVEVTLKPCP